MKLSIRKKSWLFGSLLFLGTNVAGSQDLSEELNALDDFPAEDLSESEDEGNTEAEESFDTPELSEEDLDAEGLDDELADDDLPADEDLGGELETDVVEEIPEEEAPAQAAQSPAPVPVPAAPPAPTQPSQALTGVDAEPATVLSDLSFRQLGDRVRLIVKTEKPVDFNKESRGQRRQVIAELRNIKIDNPLLKRALDTGEFAGPVAIVQAYEAKSGPLPSVKILFQLREVVDPQITRAGNELYIDFPIQTADKGAFKTAESKNAPRLPETYLSLDGKESFNGTPISLNVKEADLSDVLNFISKNTGRNFVISGGVAAKVTLNVRNEPWDKVLSIILLNAKLGYQKLGDTYRIVPVADLKTEVADAAKTAEESIKLVPLQTRLVPVSYAKANEVEVNVKDFLSSRGKVSIEKRTNSILVTDLPEVIDKIVSYVRSVDKQTAQVQIEGRIVEASNNFTNQLNIDWNLGPIGKGSLTNSLVNVGRFGTATSAAPNEQGGLKLKIGNLGPISAIEAMLTVAETEETARIIASPKVTVLDNREARLDDGFRTQVPIQTADGISFQQIEATLKIAVTPQVTSDGFVLLNLELAKDEPTSNPQSFRTRRAKTEMLVESGKTAVVGGVFTVSNSESEKGWPLLKNLPIFGQLFTAEQVKKSLTTELLMFISPTIVNAEKAFLTYRDNAIQDGARTNISRATPGAAKTNPAPVSGTASETSPGGGDDLNIDESGDDLDASGLDDLPEDVL